MGRLGGPEAGRGPRPAQPGGQLCQVFHLAGGLAGEARLYQLPGGGERPGGVVQRPVCGLRGGRLHPLGVRPDPLPDGGGEQAGGPGVPVDQRQLVRGPGLLPLLRPVPGGVLVYHSLRPHLGPEAHHGAGRRLLQGRAPYPHPDPGGLRLPLPPLRRGAAGGRGYRAGGHRPGGGGAEAVERGEAASLPPGDRRPGSGRGCRGDRHRNGGLPPVRDP